MNAANFNMLILVVLILITLILVYICYSNEEYYEITVSGLYQGAVGTAKDFSKYTNEKWHKLKQELKLHYKEALVRKLLKFLNNSNFTYLGENQKPSPGIDLIERETVTTGASLLQQFCLVTNKYSKSESKAWLMNVLRKNFDDYLIEQWKMKSTLHRAILSLGQNFGFLTGDEILHKYMKEIIDEDYEYILNKLKIFENKQGYNVCTGEKTSVFKKIFGKK
jgi:hypothetical protein